MPDTYHTWQASGGDRHLNFHGNRDNLQDEWTFRMYQLGNTEDRENRISCYAFNLDARAGGIRFGIGSHFQDELTPGQRLLVAGAWDTTRVSIYRDGVLRDSDLLDRAATGGVTITPEHGDAPVRIGTRDFNSFFQGAISRVAIFNRKLTDSEQAALQTASMGDTLDSAISTTVGRSGSGGWARWHEGCHRHHRRLRRHLRAGSSHYSSWAPPSAVGRVRCHWPWRAVVGRSELSTATPDTSEPGGS